MSSGRVSSSPISCLPPSQSATSLSTVAPSLSKAAASKSAMLLGGVATIATSGSSGAPYPRNVSAALPWSLPHSPCLDGRHRHQLPDGRPRWTTHSPLDHHVLKRPTPQREGATEKYIRSQRRYAERETATKQSDRAHLKQNLTQIEAGQHGAGCENLHTPICLSRRKWATSSMIRKHQNARCATAFRCSTLTSHSRGSWTRRGSAYR